MRKMKDAQGWLEYQASNLKLTGEARLEPAHLRAAELQLQPVPRRDLVRDGEAQPASVRVSRPRASDAR